MAAQGNVNPKGAAAAEGSHQGPMRPASAKQLAPDVLHQRKKLPFCPAKAAVGGFAFMATIAYLTLYSKKKPEATALDVAKVASGTASPQNTHPRK